MSSYPPDDHPHPSAGGKPSTPDPSVSDETAEPVYVPQGGAPPRGPMPPLDPPIQFPPGPYVAGQPSYAQFPGQYPPAYSPAGRLPGQSGFLNAPDPSTFRGNKPAVAAAWLVIIAIMLFIFSTTVWMQLHGTVDEGPTTQGELMQVNLQGKMLLGQQMLFNLQSDLSDEPEVSNDKGKQRSKRTPKNSASSQELSALAPLDAGPPEARYCYAILLNEFAGAESALDQLVETDRLIKRLQYEETDDQIRLREIIGTLFEQYDEGDYDTSDLPAVDREFLKEKLGWSGELALLPKNSPNVAARSWLETEARNSLFVAIGAFLLGICMLFGGMIAAGVLFILAATSGLFPRFRPQSTHGRIYVETFAIWMVGFIALQIMVGFASAILSPIISMFLTAAIFFASLLVLVWPVMRGIPFSQVRQDIGWKFANPFVEGFVAVTSYLALVPFMAFSIIFAVVIMGVMTLLQSNSGANELSRTGAVGHPIQEQIALGDPLIFLGVFLTACIAAPIVEETMFRGVLYRHLRDASSNWARFGSVFMSAMVSSLIFAAIHPQGLYGIPILATLAIGFALVREWRESLIAPMLMHAINNGLVTCLLFLIV